MDPVADLIADCVHCGFCLPACPTYDLYDEEMDSPRGRIVLMSGELSPEATVHFDRCLGCMACVTACPSGVKYDELITHTRSVQPRTRRDRLLQRAAFATFTRPGLLRAAAPLIAVGRALRLAPKLSPRIALRPRLAASPPRVRLSAGPPPVTPPRGTPRGRVALLQGCVQRAWYGRVNAAAARMLAAEGWEVHAPPAPRCCGALPFHEGALKPARDLARETVAALGGFDHVVATAAGCGSAMKAYGELLDGEGAQPFAERVRDVTELLAEGEPRAPRHPVARRVAYHDACHLAHAQGVRTPPRELLQGIPGLELLEPREADRCCGSAGIYNLREPRAAAELGRRKADALRETGAEVVAAGNPGCALQIEAHLAGIRVVHPVELIDESIRG